MGTNTLKTDIVFPTTSDGSLSLFGNSSGSATSTGITIDSSGVVTTTGALDIGNQTTDTVTVTARFDSDLIPSTDNARDLGSVTLEWKDLYIDGTAYLDTAEVGIATIGTATATSSFNGNLNSDLISAESSGSDVLFGDNIDLQTNILKTSASNQNITITPSGTGSLVVTGATNPASVALNDEANTYSVTLTVPTSASLGSSYTLTLPTSDGNNGQVLVTMEVVTSLGQRLLEPEPSLLLLFQEQMALRWIPAHRLQPQEQFSLDSTPTRLFPILKHLLEIIGSMLVPWLEIAQTMLRR